MNSAHVARRAFHVPADFVDDDPTLEMELTPEQREMLCRAAEGEPEPPRPPAPRNVPEPSLVLVPAQAERPPPVARAVEVVPAESHPLTVEVLTAAVAPAQPKEINAHPAAAARVRTSRASVSSLAIGLGIVGLFALSAGVAYLADRNAPAPLKPAPPTPTEIAPTAPATTTPTAPPALPDEEPPEILRVRFTNPFDATEVFEFPAGTTEAEARAAVADLLLKRAQQRLNPPRNRVAKRG
jgi:hypothetical protein